MHAIKKEKKSKALQIAFLFCTIVSLLILLSLAVKVAVVIARSKFDGQHQFILQVNEKQTKGVDIVFSPDTHTISLLSVTGDGADKNALQTVGLPIDAKVSASLDDATGSDLVKHALFSGHDSLNVLDRWKLLLFTQTVASDDVMSKTIHLPAPTGMDTALTQIGTDQTLYKEGMTISIINGSGISGLGNAVARVLTHIGANVISVTTADKDEDRSQIIFTGKKTYTSGRLGQLFGIVPTPTAKPGIADITFVIGKDKGASYKPL